MNRRFFFPIYVFLYHLLHFSLASTPGRLAFFLDESCDQASIINPTVDLPVNTCLVTHGAIGIAVETLPPCTSGDATMIMYLDTLCARPDDSGIQFNNCYFNGPNGVRAVLFACKQAAGGTAATATSTVSAGSSSLPVAAGTPVAGSSGGAAEQTTPSLNGATTTSNPTSKFTSTSSSPTNASSGGNGSGSSSSGLSQKGQIALGIVLPVATIVVALLTWWFPCRQRRRRQGQADQYNMMHFQPSQGAAPSFTVGTPQPGQPSW